MAQIVLMDGRQMDTNDISWNKDSYHFVVKSTGEDITDNITRAIKLANWPGFDQYRENQRVYAEQPYRRQLAGQPPISSGPAEDLPSGSLFILSETAKDTAKDIGKNAGSFITTSTQTLIIFGIAGFVAYMLLSKK